MKLVLVVSVLAAACGGGPQAAPPPARPTPAPVATVAEPARPPAQINGTFINDGCATMATPKPEALDLLQKACAGKDGQGCSVLTGYYLCGKSVSRDLAKATQLSALGCDAGYMSACSDVSMMVMYPDAKIDPSVAFNYAEKGCNGGDSASCNSFAMMLLQGVGTKADPARSAKIFDELCQKQNASACANLAMQVYLGVGTPRDLRRAATLSEAACKANMPAACNTLAGILVEQGGDENMRRAQVMFTAICNQPNSAGACDNLGQLNARGVGTKPPDKDKAATIFKKACDAGFAKSCTHLAQLMSAP